MKFELTNKSKLDLDRYKKLIEGLLDYAGKCLELDEGLEIVFLHDDENSKNPLGKTAYYLPKSEEIVVYATDRHIKDMMRSMVHELVHHKQKERGSFEEVSGEAEPGYALNNEDLRNMEKEAYTKGNLILRTFEDKLKNKKFDNKEMKALSKRLKDKFGFEFEA